MNKFSKTIMTKKRILFYLVFMLPFLFVYSSTQTIAPEPLPLWELVLYNGFLRLPHYRGSDEYHHYVLPLPYIIYRGAFLKVDREGIKGIFFKTDRWVSTISLYGNPPVNDDNEARIGMKELDPVFEIGPSVKYYFLKTPVKSLNISLAFRAVISIDADGALHFKHQGERAGINLIYVNKYFLDRSSLKFGFNLGLDFGDSEYHRYFYEVKNNEVLPERPFYKPSKGYSGAIASFNFVETLNEKVSLGLYARYDYLGGTVYENSPLVKSIHNYFAGFALIWKFAKSKKQVDYKDLPEGIE